VEKKTYEYLEEVENRGGIFECLDSSWLNDIMETNRVKIQREQEDGKRLIIGVNAFRETGEEGPINSAIRGVAYKAPSVDQRREKVNEVRLFKESREQNTVKRAVRELYQMTKDGGNLSTSIIGGFKAGMTTGETVGVIRSGYGIPYDPFEQIDTPEVIIQSIRG
jgi:methylmalonyl-CoA mutase N-terminal domain/subunit